METMLHKFRFYLGLLIPLAYLGMGIYVMIEKIFIKKLDPVLAYSLGIVLVAYGLFRGYRVLKEFKEHQKWERHFSF